MAPLSLYLFSCSTSSSDKSKRPTFWGAGRTSHKDGLDRADLDPDWRSSRKGGKGNGKEESSIPAAAASLATAALTATTNASVRSVHTSTHLY